VGEAYESTVSQLTTCSWGFHIVEIASPSALVIWQTIVNCEGDLTITPFVGDDAEQRARQAAWTEIERRYNEYSSDPLFNTHGGFASWREQFAGSSNDYELAWQDLEAGYHDSLHIECVEIGNPSFMVAALAKARAFFRAGDTPEDQAMVEEIDAALVPAPSPRKPLVYVTVDGGVAEIEVEEPGSALVLLYDYDNASQDADYPEEPETWEARRARAEEIEAERIAAEQEG
jgi:hypothetical protein